jgi:hypothetical protein
VHAIWIAKAASSSFLGAAPSTIARAAFTAISEIPPPGSRAARRHRNSQIKNMLMPAKNVIQPIQIPIIKYLLSFMVEENLSDLKVPGAASEPTEQVQRFSTLRDAATEFDQTQLIPTTSNGQLARIGVTARLAIAEAARINDV